MIPEPIAKLTEELETLRNEITEKRKDLATCTRRERALMQKVEATWQAQFARIVQTIRGITGE